MSAKNIKKESASSPGIRICLACGVVNPAGPSAACAHLQVAVFQTIYDDLEAMMTRVAQARRQYIELVDQLMNHAKKQIKKGDARIETSSERIRAHSTDGLPKKPAKPAPPLTLQSPKAPKNKPARRKVLSPRRKRAGGVVDPRQLDLLVREPPKGHA